MCPAPNDPTLAAANAPGGSDPTGLTWVAPLWEAAGSVGKCAEGLFAGVMGWMAPTSAWRSSLCAKPDLDRPRVLPDSAIALAAAALARAAAAMALEAVIDLVDDAKPGLAPAASGFLPKAGV